MSTIIFPTDKKNEAHRLAAMIHPKGKDSFMGNSTINEYKLHHTYPGTRSAIISRNMYDMCPCCLEAFPDVKPIKLLCCRHAVCEHCISNIKEARCPLCREVFPLHVYKSQESINSYLNAQRKLQRFINNCFIHPGVKTTSEVFIYLCGEGYILMHNPSFRFIVLKKLAELHNDWEHSYKFYVILFSHFEPPLKTVRKDEKSSPPPLRRSRRLRRLRNQL